jgi:hypothetical protein
MDFSKDIKELFIEAGWRPGRNVQGQYQLPISGYPPFVIAFLNEYANLEVKCGKIDSSSAINELEMNPNCSKQEYDDGGFYHYFMGLLGQPLYAIGYCTEDYELCCDAAGRVYVMDEQLCYRGKNLREGIENVMRSNWKDSLVLDEDNIKWWNDSGEHVPLP